MSVDVARTLGAAIPTKTQNIPTLSDLSLYTIFDYFKIL